MRDASFLLAVFAMLFLAVAGLAWFRIIRKPDKQPPTKKDVKRGGSAAMIIFIAFGLSAAAAVTAIIGWFQR
jgi:ABC-type Fe3+-siderophore transport system permease subunit